VPRAIGIESRQTPPVADGVSLTGFHTVKSPLTSTVRAPGAETSIITIPFEDGNALNVVTASLDSTREEPSACEELLVADSRAFTVVVGFVRQVERRPADIPRHRDDRR